MTESPRDDVVRRIRGRRFRRYKHRAAAGKLRQARPLHTAARQRAAKVVGPRMHDRAVTDVDAVVHVHHGRAGQPSFHPQSIATRHLSVLRTGLPTGLRRKTPVDCLSAAVIHLRLYAPLSAPVHLRWFACSTANATGAHQTLTV